MLTKVKLRKNDRSQTVYRKLQNVRALDDITAHDPYITHRATITYQGKKIDAYLEVSREHGHRWIAHA